MSTSDYIDIGVLAVVGLSALFGFWRGFIREVFVLVAWGVAAIAALKLTDFTYGFVLDLFPNPDEYEIIARAATFVGLFILTLFLFSYVGARLSDAITDRGVTAINRSLGAAYGIARGLVLAGAAMLLVHGWVLAQDSAAALPQDIPEPIRKARSFEVADFAAVFIKDVGRGIAPDLIASYLDPQPAADGAAPDAGGGVDPLQPLQVRPEGVAADGDPGGYSERATQDLERLTNSLDREAAGGASAAPPAVTPDTAIVPESPLFRVDPAGVAPEEDPRPPRRP